MNRRSSRILVVAGMLAALAGSASAQTATPAAPAPPAFRLIAIGPPAPVPPEVAMLRPGAEELQQINAALRRFIDSDKSDARATLKKYESLMLLQPPRLNVAATFTQTTQRMGPRHEGFVEIAKQGNIDLLLHGDSITDWWVQGDANKAMFEKYFGEHQDRELRDRRRHDAGRAVGPAERRGPGLSAEGRDADDRHQQHRRAHRAGDRRGHRRGRARDAAGTFPNAKILLLAIFPRGVPGDPVRDKIAEVNRIIARLDDQQHVFFMDIGAKFLDEKGFFLPDAFRPDNLHPQAKGYDIWGEAVKAKLAELMK